MIIGLIPHTLKINPVTPKCKPYSLIFKQIKASIKCIIINPIKFKTEISEFYYTVIYQLPKQQEFPIVNTQISTPN